MLFRALIATDISNNVSGNVFISMIFFLANERRFGVWKSIRKECEIDWTTFRSPTRSWKSLEFPIIKSASIFISLGHERKSLIVFTPKMTSEEALAFVNTPMNREWLSVTPEESSNTTWTSPVYDFDDLMTFIVVSLKTFLSTKSFYQNSGKENREFNLTRKWENEIFFEVKR